MNPSVITLIINIVLLLFIGLGFLFGLKGIKKSTFSLCLFIIQLLVVFLLAPVVSNAVLKISISGQTINEHIISAINEMLGSEASSSAFVKDAVNNLPLMLVNIVSTILLVIVLSFIFKLIGIIIYKLIFKKDKEKVVEKCEIVNGAPQMVKTTVKKKKYRVAGGFVGAFHGFLLALVIFMPLCGLVNVFNDVAGTNAVSAEVVYAEGETTGELKSIEALLQENIPSDVYDYAKAIDGSILFKIGKIGNIAETSLNIVAKTTINDTAVRLGEEIRTIVDTYDLFVDFATSSESQLSDYSIETIFNDMIENPQNYDFTKLNKVVDNLFKSNLINSLGKDALVFVMDIMVDNTTDTEMLKILTHIQIAVENYAESQHTLRGEIDAIVGVFETAVKSGLVNLIKQNDFLVEDITAILLNDADPESGKEENEVLGKICDKLTGSYLLQKLILEFANYGLENLEIYMNDNLEFSDGNPVTLTKIDSSNDYSITSEELENLASEGLGLYEIVEGLDTKAIKDDIYNIFDTDLQSLVKGVGRVLNNVVHMKMLNDTGVFSSLCDAMAKTEYSNYIDFELLKSENTITTQFNYLSDAIGELKESGVINTIRYINDENKNESINDIIGKLAVTFDNKTYVSRIVSPLLNCNLFKNAFEYVLGEAHTFLEEKLKTINENASLHEFNTDGLMTENENAQLINILNNLVQFLDGIDVAKLGGDDFVETIIYSDLNNVGRAFESIRTSKLFKDYNEHQGVYNDIMDALAGSSYADYFDFEIAKNETFTWTAATEKMIEIRTALDEIMVTTADGDVKLLKYIITSGNYDDLMDNLEGKTVDFTGVFELDLIKPISAKVINIINQTIKEFVENENGEKVNNLGANIVDIDKTANISAQSESINAVINAALAIDLDTLDIENMTDEEQEKLNTLLDALEANAKSTEFEGVFKHSYNAMLLKTINLINQAIKDATGVAGTKIVILSEPVDVLPYSDALQSLLNKVIDLSSSINPIDLTKEAIADSVVELIDAFKLVGTASPVLFEPTYNAILLYSINTINASVAEAVGAEFSTDIKSDYSDETSDVTALYNYIVEVIESGADVFKILNDAGEDAELADLAISNETELTRFKNALNSNDYTRSAYTAVLNYLADSILQ